jgi:thymidine kinase
MSNLNTIVITGPMFAGKTTKLIDIYNNYEPTDTLVFNHSFDERYYGSNNVISTHNKQCIPCMKFKTCNDIYNYLDTNNKLNHIKTIFIDECQFFTDIESFINKLKNKNTSIDTIILAGLDKDAKGKIFNQAFETIINGADIIYKLQARCYKCDGPADYSICLIKNKLDDNNVLVGDNEIYQPACYQHTNFITLN